MAWPKGKPRTGIKRKPRVPRAPRVPRPSANGKVRLVCPYDGFSVGIFDGPQKQVGPCIGCGNVFEVVWTLTLRLAHTPEVWIHEVPVETPAESLPEVIADETG